MPTEQAGDTGPAPAPTRAQDGRTMIGAVVLASVGSSLAVWQLNTAGVNSGAWVVPIDLAAPSESTAQRVLNLCLRRAVIAWQPTDALSVLARLTDAAGVRPVGWDTTAITLPEVIGEITATRSAFDKRVADERAAGRSVVPVEWPVELPTLVPATSEGFWRETRLAVPHTSPVAEDALKTCAMARWLLRRWEETMVVLRRRPYLRDEFGAPRHLPPVWETCAADAFTRHTTLIASATR